MANVVNYLYTILYLYPGGHAIELSTNGRETWPKSVFLEIQSQQVWCLEG